MNSAKYTLGFLIALVLSASISSCSKEDDEVDANFSKNSQTSPSQSIAELIRTDSRMDSLEVALIHAGLLSTFQSNAKFTLFAPTNQAFQELLDSNGTWTKIADIRGSELNQLLLYHSLAGSKASSSFRDDAYETTLNSQGANNEATVMEIDVNGGFRINNFSSIIEADMEAKNGFVHLIDKITRPQTVLELLENDERFSSFLFPLSGTLRDSLAGKDSLLRNTPLTLFIPLDSSFKKLLDSDTSWKTLSDIPRIENKIRYHVVAGSNNQASQITQGQVFNSLISKTISIDLMNGPQILTNDTNQGAINVIGTDIQGINGIIHLIDDVMLY